MNANEQTQSTSSQQENAEMKAAVEAALKSKHAKARSKRPQKKRSKTQDEPEASTSSAPVLQTNAATSDTDEEPELPTIKGLNDFSVASQENTTYVWATVVEHQRGFTFFSTPHYSTASLLPTDRPPFVASTLDGKSTTVESLEHFSLPSPKWTWVSKCWMVDMRGEGEVDVEGWEYAWSFGSKNWKARTGFLNAGGWVRRRRWVRLMMMGNDTHNHTPENKQPEGPVSLPDMDPIVWQGDSGDWERCLKKLKATNVDGLRLELWKDWLQEDGKQREWIGSVLSSRGDQIFRALTHPESRLRLLELISNNGLESCVSKSLVERVRERRSIAPVH